MKATRKRMKTSKHKSSSGNRSYAAPPIEKRSEVEFRASLRECEREVQMRTAHEIMQSDPNLLQEIHLSLDLQTTPKQFRGDPVEILKQLKSQPDLEALKQLSRLLVRMKLANQLARQIDGEDLIPPEDPLFPKDWAFEMRCLESSCRAFEWVRQVFYFLEVKEFDPTLFVTLLKLLALATEFSEYSNWVSLTF